MKQAILPVRLPHGCCHQGCPWCTPQSRADPLPSPSASQVLAMLDQPSANPEQRELAYTGAEFAAQPKQSQEELLELAHVAVRRGLVQGFRVLATPPTVLRQSLRQWKHWGMNSVELLGWSLDPAALRFLGVSWTREQVLEAIRRLDGAGLQPGLHLLVGSPGPSGKEESEALEGLRATGLAFVRLLPRLALQGHDVHEVRPLDLNEAVERCADLCQRCESLGVSVARLGLQPRVDLLESSRTLAGPYHPSLRTLVETLRWRRRVEALLTRQGRVGGQVILRCHPVDEAHLRGYQSTNIIQLRRRFRLHALKVAPDLGLSRGSLEMGEDEARRVGSS